MWLGLEIPIPASIGLPAIDWSMKFHLYCIEVTDATISFLLSWFIIYSKFSGFYSFQTGWKPLETSLQSVEKVRKSWGTEVGEADGHGLGQGDFPEKRGKRRGDSTKSELGIR